MTRVPDAGERGEPTVLVIGARGFLGRHIARALEAAGCRVVRGARPAIDFARDAQPSAWATRLANVDAVVNAVGIFREQGAQTFEAIHVRGPVALFQACAAARIPCVQISALGADARALTRFLQSKKRADDALLALDVPSAVLQPSLVFGNGGASARLFTVLASLPLVPLPAGGRERVQPVHVDDVVDAVVAVVRRGVYPRRRIALVGPRALTLREFLFALRAALGLGRAPSVSIPAPLVEFGARIGSALDLMFDADAWKMLERGNTADAGDIAALLGREPRTVDRFVAPDDRDALATSARLAWLLPVVRASLAFMWIAAGVVSAGLYPVSASLALLARVGVHGALASAMLYGAALLDVALGVATLVLRRRRGLWRAQIALIVGYTAIITVALPEQWLHPFGPVVKNLPVLAAIIVLYALEKR